MLPVLRKLRKKNSAKPRKTHCVSCAKIAQKFAKKNLRENSANFAQKISPFRGNPREKEVRQDRTSKIGLEGQDKRDRIRDMDKSGMIREIGQQSQDKKGRTRQIGQERYGKNERTRVERQERQDKRYKTAVVGQKG